MPFTWPPLFSDKALLFVIEKVGFVHSAHRVFAILLRYLFAWNNQPNVFITVYHPLSVSQWWKQYSYEYAGGVVVPACQTAALTLFCRPRAFFSLSSLGSAGLALRMLSQIKEIKEFVNGDGWQEPDSVSSRPSRRHLLGGSVKFLGGVLELSDTPSAQMTVNGAVTASSVTLGQLR